MTANHGKHRQRFPDGFEVVIPCLLEGEGMIDAVDCASMGGRIIVRLHWHWLSL